MNHSIEHTAANIKPLIALAKTAYGSQPAGSPARVASDQLNTFLLAYAESGGSLPALAQELDGELSLSGLRRRLRIARGPKEQVVGRVPRKRGSKDPVLVEKAVEKIRLAREIGGRAYGDAVRDVYDEGISLKLVAESLGVSSYSLWSARRTSW